MTGPCFRGAVVIDRRRLPSSPVSRRDHIPRSSVSSLESRLANNVETMLDINHTAEVDSSLPPMSVGGRKTATAVFPGSPELSTSPALKVHTSGQIWNASLKDLLRYDQLHILSWTSGRGEEDLVELLGSCASKDATSA